MNKTVKNIFFIAWALLMAWGLFGVFQRMTQGELLVNYGSYVPWGLWVAAKTYFVGISVGAAILTWVIWAFGIERLQPVVRPALLVSIITMMAGLIVITFDLGHMFRTIEVFYRPNFSSMLAIATWLSIAHLIYLAMALRVDLKSSETSITSRKKVYGWIGLALAIMFSGGNGAEFAAMISSPYWHSSLGPILSIGGALLSGVAIVFASMALFPIAQNPMDSNLTKILSRLLTGLILFVLLLEWSEFSISMWYSRGADYDLLRSILFGPYAYVFWGFHIGLGVVLPLILLVTRPGGRIPAGTGALLAGVFYFAVRLNHVIPGQMTPAMKGLKEAYSDKWLSFSYFPSSNEWAVFGFTIAVAVGLFYIGTRLFTGHSSHVIHEGGK